MTKKFNIVKSAEDSMTTYRVTDMKTADNLAICQALNEAAKDVWKYFTAHPGTYTAAEVLSKKAGAIIPRDGVEMPAELHMLRVVCGPFNFRVGRIDSNYYTLFRALASFEKLARVKQNDKAVFTVSRDLGERICEARIILPTNIKAICDCCADDPLRPSMNYPALDLVRRCIVATDGSVMVAKKVTVTSINYKDNVPETFYLPMEVTRMQGEVTVKLYEHGCSVTDQKGTEVSVEHECRYPSWHTVWPTLRGGTTIVDSKAWTKVVKRAANGLLHNGKCRKGSLLLTHYPASTNLTLRGYDGAEMKNEQRITDCIATDEVPYRLGVNYVRLLKALALNPKLMWMGYSEYGYSEYDGQPRCLVMENLQEEMAVILMRYEPDDLQEVLRDTMQEYVVDSRRLYHCFDKDGWLLEETKFSSGGESPEPPKPTKVLTKPAQQRSKTSPVKTISAIHNTKETIAGRLRTALMARLAA